MNSDAASPRAPAFGLVYASESEIPTFTNVSPVNLDYQLQVYFALKPYNDFYDSMILFELATFHNPAVCEAVFHFIPALCERDHGKSTIM